MDCQLFIIVLDHQVAHETDVDWYWDLRYTYGAVVHFKVGLDVFEVGVGGHSDG